MPSFQAPLCLTCKHFLDAVGPEDEEGERTGPLGCTAFPDGIPIEILESRHDHHKPFPGDQGIRYEKQPDE